MESRQSTTPATAKRKRSSSGEAPAPAVKPIKAHTNHLQINYLARQYAENLPVVSADDTLPSILTLIGDYDGVLQRHESMAGNLGAKPLGPILIKRFERLFDGPPRVLKTHGKEGTTVSWLDVVEFARNKPEQFNLEKMRNGVRVCQFYTKQSRVEISEEDYVLIASGMPQKLIPPQPIVEDEEKELGTLKILEKNLTQVVQLADQVSARARQLNHRLKNRRNAIVTRREAEAAVQRSLAGRSASPVPMHHIGNSMQASSSANPNGDDRKSHSPASGFVAVNARRPGQANSSPVPTGHTQEMPNTSNVTIVNGTSVRGASPATRAELMTRFFFSNERRHHDQSARDHSSRRTSLSDSRRSPAAPNPVMHLESRHHSRNSLDTGDYATLLLNSASAVPIPNTPSSLLPYAKPLPPEKDDGGPYKAEMVARMGHLQKGDRVLPPCDRCRRLHMDCLKKLTACEGCTRKHAKCSWREVREEEMLEGREGNGDEGDEEEDDHVRTEYHRDPPMATEDVVETHEEAELSEQGLAQPNEVTEQVSNDTPEKALIDMPESRTEPSVQASSEGAPERGEPAKSGQTDNPIGQELAMEPGQQ